MCLGVPGKVIEIEEIGGFLRGKVEITGVVKDVSLDFVPEAEVGNYVLVHAGYANSIIEEKEAEETMKLLEAVTDPLNQGV